jgi:hypothetical protein
LVEPEGGVVCVIELTLHSELYAWQVELPWANAVPGTISANAATKVAIRFIRFPCLCYVVLKPAPTL